jgi:hypothetical protein
MGRRGWRVGEGYRGKKEKGAGGERKEERREGRGEEKEFV